MSGEDIFCDPWLKESHDINHLPENAVFICSYGIEVLFDEEMECAFLHRTKTRDELWTLQERGSYDIIRAIAYGSASVKEIDPDNIIKVGLAFSIPKAKDELSASLSLLELLIRAYYGMVGIEGLYIPGIMSGIEFDSLTKKIWHEFSVTAEETRQRETAIIRVARELGLNPRPTGTDLDFWQARCPKTNHVLYINAALDSFGCGYCRRKGGQEALRQFVKDRNR